jgi:hypothetical protein
MDSKNEYKQLYTLTHVTDLDTHLVIGSEIKVQQVTYLITAFIVYESRTGQWLEYQLYSPTHGYAKLFDKDQKKIFLSKSHYRADKNIWMMNQGESFLSNNVEFKITEFQHAEIYYAAGNHIDSIKQGKRNKQCFAKSENYWFHSVYSLNEVKNYVGREIYL